MASRDHRRQARTAPPPGAESRTDPRGASGAGAGLRRRDLFGAAVGVTSAALAVMAPAARAQQPSGTTPGTTPGSVPAPAGDAGGAGGGADDALVTGADLEKARFFRSVELALVAVYQSAVDSRRLRGVAGDSAAIFLGHHRDHADRLEELVGSGGPSTPNPGLLSSLSPRVANARDEREAMNALRDIEERAAATYLSALGEVEDWQFAALIATIAPVDAQHATAWSRLAEPDAAAWLARSDEALPELQETGDRWDAAQFPVGAA